MTPEEFFDRWHGTKLGERQSYQSHFIDVCHLVGVEPPGGSGQDAQGNTFVFEESVKKTTGEQGFADVWYQGHFGMEYKAPGKYLTLDDAYHQLLDYRERLENPPLLVVTDIAQWEIHTNWPNTTKIVDRFSHQDIRDSADVRRTLRDLFHAPNNLHPRRRAEKVTLEAAEAFRRVADELRKFDQLQQEQNAERIAHFLTKVVFCLFAEDIGLLPTSNSGFGMFTELVRETRTKPSDFVTYARQLFDAMNTGGQYQYRDVHYFDGTLFADIDIAEPGPDALIELLKAAALDWSKIEPAIFGTLFERSLDPAKRAQLGAHYTSRDDIMLIVEPVLMAPLRRAWESTQTDAELQRQQHDAAKTTAERVKIQKKLEALRDGMLKQVREMKVLDPACGSGNFLYVSLQQLMDLEHEIIRHPAWADILTRPFYEVHPRQMYGIEINEIAHDLASIVVWIGWIQWHITHGYQIRSTPILEPLSHNIRRMDAILAFDADGNPVEPDWPAVDVIVGNPPFLGAKKMISQLSEHYVLQMRSVYEGRLPAFTDLVAFWLERARMEISKNRAKRAGLLATNSIGMGTNMTVLKNIKESGDIFMAWSDRDWILDGAAVRVAMIGFDDGSEKKKYLDGEPISKINADLSSQIDVTVALQLNENERIGFIGVQKSGPFDISTEAANLMLNSKNDSGISNSNVIHQLYNGTDIVRRPRGKYIIDFGVNTSQEEAKNYHLPFQYVTENVIPARTAKHFQDYPYWLLWNTRPAMREAMKGRKRYIATPTVAKHRVFVWLGQNITPDKQLVAIARDDDYFFGVLHSKLHEVWSLRMGTWLGKGNDPRYTPTTTFETFPFPWAPGAEDPTHPAHGRISAAAAALHAERHAWQHPAHIVGDHTPPYPDAIEKQLKDRTLTNLYNALAVFRGQDSGKTKPSAANFAPRLDELHRELDEAVCDAYGWPYDVLDDEEDILRRLLALNLERAGEA